MLIRMSRRSASRKHCSEPLKARTSSVPVPLFIQPADAEEYDERTFLDGPLPGLYDSDPGNDDWILTPRCWCCNRILIWRSVIFVAAVLAGVAAHLNGTAFWQR